jgi:TolB-like protein
MTRIARFTSLAVAVVGLAAPLALHAQAGKPTVAVLQFTNGSFGKDAKDYDGLSKGIPDFLITDMSANTNIRVLERDQVQKLVDEQKLVSGGQVDKETAVKIGKLLGVHHMIFGSYVSDRKERVRFDARAVNVETGQIEHVETVSGKLDDFSDLITTLAAKLNSGLKLPAMPAHTAQAPAKPPFQVVMLYSRAIAEENGGRPEEAVKLYRAALDKFPEYAPAKKALDRLASPKSGD